MGRACFHALARAFFSRNRSQHRHRQVSVVPGARRLSKRHQLLRYSLRLSWMLLTLGVGMVAPHTEAFAAASFPPGYSLTLTESTSMMTYGGTPPTFQAQLMVPAGENPLMSPNQFFFTVDTGSTGYGPDSSASNGSTYTLSWNGTSVVTPPSLPVGQHTVVAHYFSSVLKQTLQSAPVTFTVQKRTPTVMCDITAGTIYAVNASVTFSMGTLNGPPIDWQDATYSITFVGTHTFTDSNLILQQHLHERS